MPNSNLSRFKLGKRWPIREEGTWLMFPSKKKNGRLARLGEQPLHPNYKTREGNVLGIQKLPPLFKKRKNTKACGLLLP